MKITDKIITLGNSLMDISVAIDSDCVLEELNLPKASMQLVDVDTQHAINNAVADGVITYTPGGSAANTARGLAALGSAVSFIGKVGEDAVGDNFIDEMNKYGVKALITKGNNPSGQCVALVSPDSERTMATYLGASIELSQADITEELFEGHSLIHIEGYLIINRELMLKALHVAKSKGLCIALDLASYNVVDDNREFICEIVNKYVDILFANEQEAMSLTGLEPQKAVEAIGEMCEVAVVKVGAAGSYIKSGHVTHHVEACPAKAVDTTAAGDLYAAGFLHGFTNGLTLDKCGMIGSLVAGKVIEVSGTTISHEIWCEIHTRVDQIKQE